MLDGLQALLTWQRSLFPRPLIPFPSSRYSSSPLVTSSPRTFKRPFAPWLHVWLSLPKKPLMCDQLTARYFLPVTSSEHKKGKRSILDRKKNMHINPLLFHSSSHNRNNLLAKASLSRFLLTITKFKMIKGNILYHNNAY